jgi:hypothetical protein
LKGEGILSCISEQKVSSEAVGLIARNSAYLFPELILAGLGKINIQFLFNPVTSFEELRCLTRCYLK